MIKNFKIRIQMGLLLAVACMALLSVGIIGWITAHQTALEIDRVFNGGLERTAALFRVMKIIQVNLAEPIRRIEEGNLPAIDFLTMIREAKDQINEEWGRYVNSDIQVGGALARTHQNVADKTRAVLDSLESVLSRIPDYLQSEKGQLGSFLDQQFYPLLTPLMQNLQQLVEIHSQDGRHDYEVAIQTASWLQNVILLSLGIALLILIPLTFSIARGITIPLEYAAKRIASGDSTMDATLEAGGEIGDLLHALANLFLATEKMSAVLNAISHGDLTIDPTIRSQQDLLGRALQDMVIRMRAMIGEIKREMSTLAVSSKDITSSLTHISSAAAETASAVAETTTTIEELKQTSNVSVEKAKDVLKNAEDTMKAMAFSEESVSATIEDMNQIRDRMQIISDSIVKLSEKGLAISEIMDTVNDIAEQSNLLAVNAAIEAAKAGEMGRSFAVVAQEIRTLAEQSKGATIQVRSLLGEIQNATSAAILATEQGSKAVAKGVDQSTVTTKTIKELGVKMGFVAQAANQIVLSNQQQLVGTEQITIAMTQINESSNQHVEHLKQIESVMHTLNQIGSSLKELTDSYHLPQERSKLPSAIDIPVKPHQLVGHSS